MKYLPMLTGTMSGSMGATVASHNRGGTYFRNRTVPTNPNSSRQQTIKTAFGNLAVAWGQSLDSGQRQAWQTYAENVPRQDRLGQELILTGQQQFIANNTPRLQLGLNMQLTAPTTFSRGAGITTLFGAGANQPSVENTIGIITATPLTSAEFNFAVPASDAGELAIYIGRPVNPTINFYRGPYQLAGTIPIVADDTSEAWGVDPATLSIEEPLVVGQRRGVRAVAIYDDGRTSVAFETLADIINDDI